MVERAAEWPLNSRILEGTPSLSPESLTEAQLRLLALCIKLGWGRLEIKVKDGQPVFAAIITQEFKLD